jgi:transposase InsO family protein
MESFWNALTWECIAGIVFPTRQLAKHTIFKYSDCFYYRHRRHSTVGYLSPSQFEAQMTEPPLSSIYKSGSYAAFVLASGSQ